MLTLDGSRGGGQILRTALSLSLVTGLPFHIHTTRGHLAGRDLTRLLESDALVTGRLADQLLLPLALAGGGTLTTTNATNHIHTNLHTIAQFIAGNFAVDPGASGLAKIEIHPQI